MYVDLATLQTIATGQPFAAATLEQIRLNGEFLIDPPVCSVHQQATTQVVADNTSTVMAAGQESFDNDSMHSTSSNTSRITIQTAGRYLFFSTLWFAADVDGHRVLRLMVDGAGTYDMQVLWTAGSGTQTVLSGSKPLALTAGQYVEVVAAHLAGGNLNVTLLDFTAIFLTR